MVKSAVRVMEILELVCRNKTGLTQKEISKELEIPKSSLSSILTDMTSQKYLSMDQLTKQFSLGPKVLMLAGGYLENQDVAGPGRPLVARLSRETEESAALAVRAGSDALIVYKEDCLQPILPSIQIGSSFPLYASAAGKAMLAHDTDRDIHRYLESVDLLPLTKHTVTDKTQLLSELRAIRKGSPAYNREGFREGITAIAAPVFYHNGKVAAAISISALTIRLTTEKQSRIEDILTKVAIHFSGLLGYSPE